MAKRLMLKERQRPATSGSFKHGNQVAIGNRGLPAARRLTNRFFAETLFHELTALLPAA